MQGTPSDIQVSLDGALVIAERTGKYAGLLGPFWWGKRGKWQEDVWLDDTPPAAAKVGVLRTDYREPFWEIADFDRYCRRGPDGEPQGPWRTMAHLMLARCAKLQALRRAFPEELEGLQAAAHAADDTPDEPSAARRRTSMQQETQIATEIHRLLEDARQRVAGKYTGRVGPFWCRSDGTWHDTWPEATPPVAVKVGVRRSDCPEPVWAVVHFAPSHWERVGGPSEDKAKRFVEYAELLALERAFEFAARGTEQ